MNRELLNSIKNCLDNRQDVMLSGLSGSARTFLLHEFYLISPGKLLCIVPGEEQAYDLFNDLKGLVGLNKISLFLERDFVFMKENTSQIEMERISALQELLNHPRRKSIIITTIGGLLYRIISPQYIKKANLPLEVGQDYPLNNLLRQLVAAGYERVDTVTRPG
ncbi:MAG: transcription-repair coupling factor, partial [Syntrophomonas sp.]